MIVDVARTARKTIMYFFELPTPRASTSLPGILPSAARAAFGWFAATKRETLVRWYKAPPGAKRLPVENAFMLADWYNDYERCDMTTGEAPWQRWQYDKGQAPQGATGQSFCGTAADFYAARPWEPDPAKRRTLMRGPTGLPICCNPALRGAIGWTGLAPQPEISALGLSDASIAECGLGLRGEVNHSVCPGVDWPTVLFVTLNVPFLPDLDGKTFQVPVIQDGEDFFWYLDTFVSGKELVIQINADSTSPPEFVEALMNFCPSGAFGSSIPYYFAFNDIFSGWVCSPFSFATTGELLGNGFPDPPGEFCTFTIASEY
jgi:hypothetical protein